MCRSLPPEARAARGGAGPWARRGRSRPTPPEEARGDDTHAGWSRAEQSRAAAELAWLGSPTRPPYLKIRYSTDTRSIFPAGPRCSPPAGAGWAREPNILVRIVGTSAGISSSLGSACLLFLCRVLSLKKSVATYLKKAVDRAGIGKHEMSTDYIGEL